MSDTLAVRARLIDVLTSSLNVELPDDEVDLFETGTLDSLAFVELLFQLERVFGIETSVDDLDPENFRTLGCIVSFVGGRIAGAERGPEWVAPPRARAG